MTPPADPVKARDTAVKVGDDYSRQCSSQPNPSDELQQLVAQWTNTVVLCEVWIELRKINDRAEKLDGTYKGTNEPTTHTLYPD